MAKTVFLANFLSPQQFSEDITMWNFPAQNKCLGDGNLAKNAVFCHNNFFHPAWRQMFRDTSVMIFSSSLRRELALLDASSLDENSYICIN